MPCAFAKILSFSPRKRSTSSYNWAYLVAGGGLHDPNPLPFLQLNITGMIFVLVFFEHIFLTSYPHAGDDAGPEAACLNSLPQLKLSLRCTGFDERNIRTLSELSQVGEVVSTFHQKDSKCNLNDIFPAHIIKRPLNGIEAYPCFFLSDKVQGTVLPNGSATRAAGLNFGDQPLAFAVHGKGVSLFLLEERYKTKLVSHLAME